MTRPTARVLALLEILQAGGTHTVGELATRLGVDERTVRRYAAHLVDLDVPVRSVRGRYGGYRLSPGYRLPPLMFTDDEALAVLLGLLTARPAAGPAAAESAAAKLHRVLPAQLADRLAALRDTAELPAATATAPEADVLLLLAQASRDRRPVEIGYTARDGRSGRRTVQPYGIVAHGGRWYLAGPDSASGELRTFRLDRIDAPRVRPGRFEVPAGFDPTDHVLSALARTPWRYRVALRVQAPTEQIRTGLPASVAVLHEPDDDGWVRVELRAERLDWVPAVLAGLDAPFTIEGPAELRGLVRGLAARLLAAASDTGAGLAPDAGDDAGGSKAPDAGDDAGGSKAPDAGDDAGSCQAPDGSVGGRPAADGV
ncbi:transcriptional regulator [Actinocatenispora thailandica]|uniref:Transcriptional regulator n=1 Tax=Actinocatenispora thailandica TaxID=227318 RepID=A0A7R7DRF7_9ACTN|nr:transcriptional regulator [Actinocatenispora thailandica]